ncbi:hypothetical protein [Prosthecomicrobium sp. N25]|uniref:hypothetical protein n=1 Tax=Prosthecomicrobium sp. N25 TaxID=3129254 RepID=UPI003077F7F1
MRTAIILGFSLLSPAMAADFESPPSYNAGKLLGSSARGSNYSVADSVKSDGLLRSYSVVTSYGRFDIQGDQMLRLRMRELRALEALEKTSQSEAFANAVKNAGEAPIRFAGNLVTAPGATIKNSITGVGEFFGGVASGVRNAGKTSEGAVASITGTSRQKRLLGYQYGVDPYTDFPPLAARLDQLAEAAAIGGLAVTGVFIAIPGAAGTVISNVSTADKLNDMVRDASAAQLADANRAKLAALGIDADTANELITSPYYTPVDVTSLVAALGDLRDVGGLDVMVDRAASVKSRSLAYLVRRRTELTAAYHRRTHTLQRFVRFGASPFPMTTTTSNGIVSVLPVDALAWTRETSRAIVEVTQAARASGITGPLELRLTGSATPRAKAELKTLGWTVVESISD